MKDTSLNLGLSSHMGGWFLTINEESDATLLQKEITFGLNSVSNKSTSAYQKIIQKGFGFGLCVPEQYKTLSTWSLYEDKHHICFLEGAFYDSYHSYRPLCGQETKLARLLLEQSLVNHNKAIENLSGSFRGFIFNKNTRVLQTFVDRLATKVLYWTSGKGKTIISSNLITMCKLKKCELAPKSAFQYLTIGYPIGEKTLLKNVFIQLPSSVLTFNGKAPISSRYWNIPQRPAFSEYNVEESLSRITHGVENAISRLYNRTGSPLALGLSGGHDSRVILSALAYQDIPFIPIRWVDNNFNDEIAQSLCLKIKKPLHIMRDRSKEELRDIHNNVFRYSDGFYFYPDGFTSLGKECSEQHLESLLLGYGGDVVSGATIIPAPQYLHSLEELASYTLQNHMELMSFGDAVKVMKYVDSDVVDETLSEWYQSFEEHSTSQTLLDISIMQGLTNREFKRVLFSMHPANEYTQVLYPYLDNEVLHAYFSVPIELIKNRRAHCYAGFYRYKEFGAYRASGYPISLKTEARYPVAVYTLRRFGAKAKFLKSKLRGYKKGNNQYNDRDGNFEDYKDAIGEILECPLFNGSIINEWFMAGTITTKIIRRLHTIRKFIFNYL